MKEMKDVIAIVSATGWQIQLNGDKIPVAAWALAKKGPNEPEFLPIIFKKGNSAADLLSNASDFKVIPPQ